MSPAILFQMQLVLGYVAWLLCFGVYIWPRLKAMDHFEAQRAIATLHSFRFFGLVFILPGVVSPDLPAGFATFAAYWDVATGVLAMLALLTVRVRPLFWLFVVAFNLVGLVDLILDRVTCRLRGFAFVEMATAEGMQKAITELDGKDFEGRPLTVKVAEDRRGGGPRDNEPRRDGGWGRGR